MLVKYYNDRELAYTSRKRFSSFNFTPFFQEEQKSILLGDGANTIVKTNKSNVCNYVTIDDTRWYVVSYVYLNGGQVQLNLQRDVVGEFGIGDCFGKIERGYTDNFLKYRKELSLNQILKNRKKLIPNSNIYGNYTVNNHENEMWGIMYFAKPTTVDPNTGNPYPNEVNINIPGFSPEVVNYEFIENGTAKKTNVRTTTDICFDVNFYGGDGGGFGYRVFIIFSYSYGWNYEVQTLFLGTCSTLTGLCVFPQGGVVKGVDECTKYVKRIGEFIGDYIIGTGTGNRDYILPTISNFEENVVDYNNITIKKDQDFFSYTTKREQQEVWGKNNLNNSEYFFDNYIMTCVNNRSFDGQTLKTLYYGDFTLSAINRVIYDVVVYNYTVISKEDAGTFVLDVSQQLVDEPYVVVATPLYNVDINGEEQYSINKDKAFMVFNTIIQYLSGENGYLVDAQIYPYCPVLTKCSTKVLGIPFFSVNSTCYEHKCTVQLLPSSDVKKEYIQRSYSIVSPEQTGKFSFNFYDYTNEIKDENGLNYASLEIIIKTALKPFSIISSAVITPKGDSLIGITYSSDLRGSQPSGNGFECSLASNAFQEYKRQNSNYQQIFSLQQQELQKQHEVERVNEQVSSVVNTISATTMGAIAGSSLAGGGKTGMIGAGLGALTAGAVVGTSMGIQYSKNEELREYEEKLQQQTFDLQIGTIKNLPNSVNRISSFNEIIMKDFWFVIEIYECSDKEKEIVDNFISKYGYGIGVFDYLVNYKKNGWFLRSTLVSSSYNVNLHLIAEKEFMGGIYLYE